MSAFVTDFRVETDPGFGFVTVRFPMLISSVALDHAAVRRLAGRLRECAELATRMAAYVVCGDNRDDPVKFRTAIGQAALLVEQFGTPAAARQDSDSTILVASWFVDAIGWLGMRRVAGEGPAATAERAGPQAVLARVVHKDIGSVPLCASDFCFVLAWLAAEREQTEREQAECAQPAQLVVPAAAADDYLP